VNHRGHQETEHNGDGEVEDEEPDDEDGVPAPQPPEQGQRGPAPGNRGEVGKRDQREQDRGKKTGRTRGKQLLCHQQDKVRDGHRGKDDQPSARPEPDRHPAIEREIAVRPLEEEKVAPVRSCDLGHAI
jgi:hypothetical protein